MATLRFGRVKTLQKVPWEGKVSKARFVSVSKLKYFKFVFKLYCQDLWKALWSSKLHERLKIFLWRVDKDVDARREQSTTNIISEFFILDISYFKFQISFFNYSTLDF